MPHRSDYELTQAIAQGDAGAWNAFVGRYGDLVMSAVISWLELDYRLPRAHHPSILRAVQANLPEPADEPSLDKEGIAVYHYAMNALKPTIAGYRGESALGAYLRLVLREVRHRYLTEELGRLTVPSEILALPSLAQDVYRLRTRLGSREAIARRLGVPIEQVSEAETLIRQKLQTTGQEWWALEQWELAPEEAEALEAEAACPRQEQAAAYWERKLDAAASADFEAHLASCAQCQRRLSFLHEAAAAGGIAPPVSVPAWVNRDIVMQTAGTGPQPPAGTVSPWQKALSQPDWLLGVALGAVASAISLLVILPGLEYSEVVREPGDALVAQAAVPLTPELADALAEARRQLDRGRVDGAIRNLKNILVARPDHLEARWLLANTYDRLGDRTSAMAHYEIYLETAKPEAEVMERRIQQASQRLGRQAEMP